MIAWLLTKNVLDLIKVLEDFIDDEKCCFDHHGYCQTHGITKPCRNKITKDVISEAKTKKITK